MVEADYENWRRVAYRFALHWGCAPSDADDIAQQALLSALEKGPAAFTHGWFYVVTRRAACQSRARNTRDVSTDTLATAVPLASADHAVLISEIGNLAALNARDRDLLRELLHGRSHSEIAVAFGWGTKSVGIRLQRLIQKIQKAILVPARERDTAPKAPCRRDP